MASRSTTKQRQHQERHERVTVASAIGDRHYSEDDYYNWDTDDRKPLPSLRRVDLVKGYVSRFDSALKKVRGAFRLTDLKEICGLYESEFGTYAEEFPCSTLYGRGQMDSHYYYKDNGSKVLAVCHLDSVQSKRWCGQVKDKKNGHIVFSPVLDDRLGAYTILKMLPRLGVNVDLLLCDDEESGQTTAGEFADSHPNIKAYNWIVEFDRAGDDVVCYSFSSPEWKEQLESYGFTVGHGTYSDISQLNSLGCKGVNIGVGYHDYHSINAYAVMEEYFGNVARFLMLYQDKQATHFPHVYTKPSYSWKTTVYASKCEWCQQDTGYRYYFEKQFICKSCFTLVSKSAIAKEGTAPGEMADPFAAEQDNELQEELRQRLITSGDVEEEEDPYDGYESIPVDVWVFLDDRLGDMYEGWEDTMVDEYIEFCSETRVRIEDMESAKLFVMAIMGQI